MNIPDKIRIIAVLIILQTGSDAWRGCSYCLVNFSGMKDDLRVTPVLLLSKTSSGSPGPAPLLNAEEPKQGLRYYYVHILKCLWGYLPPQSRYKVQVEELCWDNWFCRNASKEAVILI